MQPEPELRRAINSAYGAFEAYPRPGALDAAPTRDGKAILVELSKAPLGALTAKQLGPYSGWAVTTVGSTEDYKHFLPRIVELAVAGESWLGLMAWVIAGRMELGGFKTWPAREREAIHTLFDLAWRQARRMHPDNTGCADWLHGVAILHGTLANALGGWTSEPADDARLQIADTILGSPLTETPFEAEWRNWIAGDDVRQALLSARDHAKPHDIWRIEEALKELP